MKRDVLNGLAISALPIAASLNTAYAAPPVPMAVPDWSGFYVGLVGGYAWGTGKFTGTGTGAGQNNNVTMPAARLADVLAMTVSSTIALSSVPLPTCRRRI